MTADHPIGQEKRSLAPAVVEVLRDLFGTGPVGLHEPRFGEGEWGHLKACLESTFVSSVGPYVERFEAQLAALTGSEYVIATVNGTAALHLAMLAAGVAVGEEVLIPALTFVATANAVRYCGAIPHLVDSEERTFGLDAGRLRDYLSDISEVRAGQCVNRVTGRVIRALVPVHVFGHPADIEGLLAVAEEFNLILVEDAAESLGSFYHGRHTGTFGKLGVLSFNGNKIVTTGGGGAVLTNDPSLALRVRHLGATAKLSHRWEFIHDEVGFNYRLPGINAALGCGQLERLPAYLSAKRRLHDVYHAALEGFTGIRLLSGPDGCHSNYWLQTLVLDPDWADQRDAILAATNGAGFATRPIWTLMQRLPPFKDCPRMPLPIAESLSRRVINLPSSPHLMEPQDAR